MRLLSKTWKLAVNCEFFEKLIVLSYKHPEIWADDRDLIHFHNTAICRRAHSYVFDKDLIVERQQARVKN